MKNFELIKNNVNTDFILQEIEDAIEHEYIPPDFGASRRSERVKGRLEYLQKTFNGDFKDPHSNSGWFDLINTYGIKAEYQQKCNEDGKFLYKSKNSKHFPKTIKYLTGIAEERNAYLQRVVFAMLLPNGDVLPHRDGGEYYRYRDRQHLVLKSENGSEFTCGDKKQIFREGELWWFANKERHSVKNLGNTPRLHIIFDLLPKNHFNLKEKIVCAIYSCLFQNYRDIYGKDKFSELIDKNKHLRDVLLGNAFPV